MRTPAAGIAGVGVRSVDDPVRWERVLARLEAADALWLARQLEAPWRVAQRRREARTVALRAVRDVVAPGLRPRPAAEVIAAELGRYLATAWRQQRDLTALPGNAFPRHQALHQVAVLTGGDALGWRTVWEALRAR